MKKLLPELLLGVAIFSLIAFFNYNENKIEPTHLKPYEEFHIARNYPDGPAEYKTYNREMQKAAESFQQNSLKSLKSIPAWKNQGPYNIGGRINTIAFNPDDKNIIYVGTVCGGIFKTVNGGENWDPIFDENSYLAISHIVVDPHNPNTIYVGTGDPNISGYPWVGNGIYKSTDAGNTWENIGLNNVGIVTKIAVNTNDPNTIFAATMGIPFERDENRGLYKTTDGGTNWEKVLYLDEDAGIIDMVMLPDSPDTIFVAGWVRIRNYFESEISGPECKIYRTFDGGTNWETLTTDLPSEEMSRIGLYLSMHDGIEIIAQFIEPTTFETEGIYKSSDFGDSWDQIPANGIEEGILGNFGWYFGKVRVNPFNKNQYFILGVDLYRSDNGGNNFSITTPPWWEYAVHADKHDLVFLDSSTIILATDGGLYKSIDGGHNWTDFDNIPNTQFYRVTVDPHNIGYYAGGAQDNGTSYGNVSDSNNWSKIWGGDGFQPLFDPANPDLIYCETQNGSLYYGLKFGEEYNIDYFSNGIDESDRRSWDMPMSISTINSSVLYTGTYRIYQITDAPTGTWQPISNDLTDGTNNKYHIISAIDPSPFEINSVMAGTSDGKVHIYIDNNWTDISAGLPIRYVTCVRMSQNNKNHLFVSHSGYKANEYIPHIHFSEDFGQTWNDISGNLPQLAINSMHVLNGYNDSVIFVATDGGIYHTLNLGESWERTGKDMPVIPVYDLAYEDTTHRLVAGTFARSLMTLDLEDVIVKAPSPNNIKQETIQLGVYPNPANNYVEISLKSVLPNGSLLLFDMSGKIVKELTLQNKTKHEINIADLTNGSYLLTVYSNNNVVTTRKIIKE